MNDRLRPVPPRAGDRSRESETLALETELRHLRNVSIVLLQEALDRWAELWEEFQRQVTAGMMVLPEAQRGFRPQCGWPEFLEKLWQLKFYLDSAKRFCEPRS